MTVNHQAVNFAIFTQQAGSCLLQDQTYYKKKKIPPQSFKVEVKFMAVLSSDVPFFFFFKFVTLFSSFNIVKI